MCAADGAWKYDGHRLEPLGGTRGEIRPVSGTPQPFKEAVDALRDAPGVQAVKGILFPVRPADEGAPGGG